VGVGGLAKGTNSADFREGATSILKRMKKKKKRQNKQINE
jgi:hypothetical protein